MPQHKAKGGKAANPLHKPWTKDAGAKNARPAANKANRLAATKAQPAKAVRTVQDNENKVYGENAAFFKLVVTIDRFKRPVFLSV